MRCHGGSRCSWWGRRTQASLVCVCLLLLLLIIILTRSPVYCKRIQLRNSQVEGMQRTRYGERVRKFHALRRGANPPVPPRVHRPGSSSLFMVFSPAILLVVSVCHSLFTVYLSPPWSLSHTTYLTPDN